MLAPSKLGSYAERNDSNEAGGAGRRRKPRDEDRRLAPALAVDLAALGQDHATVAGAAVTVTPEPVRPTCQGLDESTCFDEEAHGGAGGGSDARPGSPFI